MSTAYPRPSTPETITFSHVSDDGTPISGATVTVRIRRGADGLWYDWSDGQYRARGSVVELDEPMPEIDEPGTYQVTWPGGAAGDYLAFVEADGDLVGRAELRVGGLAAPGDAMALVADDAVFLEGGRLETRAEYEMNHLPADIGFEKQVSGKRGPLKITFKDDTAWVIATTDYDGMFDGAPVSFTSAQLAVLTRDSGTWRIRSIHWSSMRR